MKPVRRLLLPALLTLGTLNCLAATDTNRVDRLMELSGLDDQISQYPAQIELGMSRASGSSELDTDELAALHIIMRDVFSAQSLRTSIRRYLLEHVEADVIDQALAWLESPLGRNITQLEAAASTPEAITAMQQQVTELAGRAGRIEIVQQLDQATGATDAVVSMTANVSAAIAIPLVMNLPSDQQPDLESVIETISAQIESQRQNFEMLTMMSFLYTYQSLSDSELERYIDFAVSDAGRRYHEATVGAVRHAFIEHGRQVGIRLSDAAQVAQQKI